MKAMILAAGRGERMRPLTDATPKPLLKVAGKMLIEYHLENLARAGITEVVINHAWLGKQLPVALGDGHAYGINIVYSDEGDTALETAGGIVNALDLLGDDPFIVVNGDIWTDYDFCQLNNRPDCQSMHLVLVDNPAHHPQGDFCLNSDGLVVEQNEAPSLTYSGIGIYSPELFTKLKTDVLPLAPLIREAISRQQVSGEHYQGQWWDIGTPARLDELDKALREQN
jgi:MurNAc alpha-1-phosphate uridylyltransferase